LKYIEAVLKINKASLSREKLAEGKEIPHGKTLKGSKSCHDLST
jgi:hypothetical protein